MQNILIVEDDMDIQELLREFLKEAGYERSEEHTSELQSH